MNKERPATDTEEETLLTSDEAAAHLGIRAATLRQWRSQGRGPVYLKRSGTKQAAVRYRPSDIAAWKEEQAKRHPYVVVRPTQ